MAQKTKRSAALAISSLTVIVFGLWIASLGVMVVGRDLALGLSAFIGAVFAVLVGTEAYAKGSWQSLGDFLRWP